VSLFEPIPSRPIAQAWRYIASVILKGLSGLPEGFLEHASPPDQLDPAHVLRFQEEQVEGVEAGGGLRVAEEAVEIRPGARHILVYSSGYRINTVRD
jgi:hypothetical protein